MALEQGLEATAAWFAAERPDRWRGVATGQPGNGSAEERLIVGVAAE